MLFQSKSSLFCGYGSHLYLLRTILEEVVLQGLADLEEHVGVDPWVAEDLI